MDPLSLSAIIGGGATLLAGATDIGFTSGQNRASRKWALEQWNRNNEYNSPKMQMQRFKEAGLNPHLIYGQGNSGPSQMPSTPEFKTPEAGRYIAQAGNTAMNAMYDVALKKAQVNNLAAQAGVIEEEKNLKRAQTLATLTGNERAQFDLGMETSLAQVSADARREQLRQLKTTTDLAINKDIREAITLGNTLTESAERILTMRLGRDKTRLDMKYQTLDMQRLRENIKLLKQDGTLKKLDIDLKKMGLQPTDELWQRLLSRFFETASKTTAPALRDKVSRGIDEFFGVDRSVIPWKIF